MNTGIDILAFFLVLVPLVILHELGHFIAAKNVGITVLEFGVGFPPRAMKLFTIGDTEYTLNWLPLGGFVRPYGEDFVRPKNEEEMKADLAEIEGRHIENPKSVFEAGPWERMWFMAAGPIFNFIGAFVIFFIIALTGQPYTVNQVSLVEILPGSPAEQAGLAPGDVVLKVDNKRITNVDEFENAIKNKDSLLVTVEREGVVQEPIELTPAPFVPEETDVKRVIIHQIEPDSLAADEGLREDDVILSVDDTPVIDKAMLEAFIVERAGDEVDFRVRRSGEEVVSLSVRLPNDVERLSDIGMRVTAFSSILEEQVVIANVFKDRPADEAGLQPDDVVVAVNGERVSDIEMVVDYVGEREGQEIAFQIRRGTELIESTIIPKDLDAEDGKAKIGIEISGAPLDETIGATIANLDPQVETRPADNLFDALGTTTRSFGRVVELIVLAPVLIIRGDISGEAARPAGPVTISRMGGEYIRQSQEEEEAFPILSFTAIISIALAVTNLLPIPGLDGGRIIFVILELLRGKPISPEREGFVHMMGLLFLLSVMAVVIAFEFIDPISVESIR